MNQILFISAMEFPRNPIWVRDDILEDFILNVYREEFERLDVIRRDSAALTNVNPAMTARLFAEEFIICNAISDGRRQCCRHRVFVEDTQVAGFFLCVSCLGGGRKFRTDSVGRLCLIVN